MKHNSNNTLLLSKDNEAARRRLRRRIINTLRKPTTQTTKLAEDRGAHPAGKRIIVNKYFTLPVVTTCKRVTTSERL